MRAHPLLTATMLVAFIASACSGSPPPVGGAGNTEIPNSDGGNRPSDGGPDEPSDGGVLDDGGTQRPEGSWEQGAVTNAAGTRNYQLWVPASYVPGTPAPLVVALHGCGQTPEEWAGLTRINALADAQNFLVLYPAQASSANPLGCWNWFLEANQRRDAGEPSLIKGMIDEVKQAYAVDASRVYVFGISAGGGMTSIMLACYADVFAAGAVASGPMYKAARTAAEAAFVGNGSPHDPDETGRLAWVCSNSRTPQRTPVIVFQGDADSVVRPVHADQVIAQFAQTNDFGDDGADDDSVQATPTRTTQGSEGGLSYTQKDIDAAGAVLLRQIVVHGLGHTWSGGDPQFSPDGDPSGPDATTRMWTFFESFQRP